MGTFGERVKSEREDRGLSIPAVAETLRVDQDWLRSLERNDFQALPDEDVMMDCLRGYAATLEVDVDLMIEDYLQEREKCLRQLEQAVTDLAIETGPVASRPDLNDRPRIPSWLSASVIFAAVVLGAWWLLSGDGPKSGTTASEAVATPAAPVADTRPTQSEAQSKVAPTRPEPPVKQSAPVPEAPAVLNVSEYGVGTGIRDRRLAGRGDRFGEGTEVWFWTRVQNGGRGDKIDHVWLREGVEAVRVTLEIGGSSWRTYSSKTLRTGSAGSWAVEARDDSGRVLAREEFTCFP